MWPFVVNYELNVLFVNGYGKTLYRFFEGVPINIGIEFTFCFTLYTKRTCSQLNRRCARSALKSY